MTFERLKEILLDMDIFEMRGSMSPPNNRVIFTCKHLRIIVTPKEGQIMNDDVLTWTFNLKRINTKELFKMLEDEDSSMIWSSMTWDDLEFGDAKDWKALKSKWLREEKLEEIL